METKYKVAVVVVLLLVSFSMGRYTVSEKVITKEIIKTIEVKVTDSDVNKLDNTTVTETVETKPDGTKVDTKVTSNTSDTNNSVHNVISDARTNATDKVSAPTAGKVNLSILGGTSLVTPGSPFFGLGVSTPVLGPITIGIFGLSNGSCGASIGLSF